MEDQLFIGLSENKYTDVRIDERFFPTRYVERLTEILRTNTSLTHLTLPLGEYYRSNPDIDPTPEFFDALRLHSLRWLSLSRIDPPSMRALLHFLETSCQLESLDLVGVNLDDSGCSELAASLAKNVGVTELDLSRNAIGDQGCEALVRCLTVNTLLKRLYLKMNHIGDAGASLLASHITQQHQLRVLNLADNKYGVESQAELMEALHHNGSIVHFTIDGRPSPDLPRLLERNTYNSDKKETTLFYFLFHRFKEVILKY